MINERECNTCKHFDILRTPTGRPKRDCTGQCLADKGGLLTLRVREVLRKVMPESCKHQIENFVSRPHWMDPYDGMDCPLWEEPC